MSSARGAAQPSSTRPKARVDGDEERGLLQLLAQRVRDVQPRRRQHGARIGRPPQHRIAVVEPREDAVTIGIHQPLQRQRAAGGEQTIRVIERLLDRWKRVGRSEERDHAKLRPPLGNPPSRVALRLALRRDSRRDRLLDGLVLRTARRIHPLRNTRRAPSGVGFELVVIQPDGSEQVEHFDDSATLARRQAELESSLSHDGWTGPFGRTI